jgi:GNAT superfamily N-acetyltransferase
MPTLASNRKGRTRVTDSESIENARRIFHEAKQLAPVLMIGPPPVADTEQNTRIDRLSNLLASASEDKEIPFLSIFEPLSRGDNWMSEVRAGDGSHPSAAGLCQTRRPGRSMAAMVVSFMTFRIEPATERDLPVILGLIKGLAEYEKLSKEVVATAESLRETLFGKKKAAEILIGYAGAEPVGFALFFHNYSTFLGRPGIYLEDLFVLPEWRRRGLGTQMLRRIASEAVARGCGRLEWSVLDWNAPAIDFYKKLGARAMDEWTVYRVTGAALEKLASEKK